MNILGLILLMFLGPIIIPLGILFVLTILILEFGFVFIVASANISKYFMYSLCEIVCSYEGIIGLGIFGGLLVLIQIVLLGHKKK